MKVLNTANNTTTILNIPKRNLNHTIVALLSALFTFVDMTKFLHGKLVVNRVQTYILMAVTYFLYVALVTILIKLLYKVIYPSKIEINEENIRLLYGFLALAVDINKFSIEEEIKDNWYIKLAHKFSTNNPALFIIQAENKKISIVIDKEELKKLK